MKKEDSQKTKTCSTCHEEKPLSEFYKYRWSKDGYRGQCKECMYIRDKKNVERVKRKIFIHYSGNPPKCQCCGETTFEFLSLDHLHNNGAEHRRTYEGAKILWWIIRNNYPEGFQVLCRNCNWAKYAYGVCPHQKKKERQAPSSPSFQRKNRKQNQLKNTP